MGGRHSRNPPKINATIPGFSYPQNILEYLLSQSTRFNITFTTPDGKSGSVNTSSPSVTTTPAPTTVTPTPVATTPIPFEAAPAYSTTLAPTTKPTDKNKKSNDKNKKTTPPVAPTLPPQIPHFWYAAIKAMEFLNELGPIVDQDKLKRLYDNLIEQIRAFKGDETDSTRNTAALIYFSTVVTLSFAPFNEVFTYNHLNGKFPKVFTNPKVYRKICMLNFYSIQLSKVFKKLRNGYISSNDRVMLYMVPQSLNAVLDLLEENIDQ